MITMIELMMRFTFHNGLLAMGIGFAILFSIPSVFATTGCNAVGWDWSHDDVRGCDLYYPAIQWMYDEGIAEGELQEVLPAGEKRLFHPDRPINRAEFTKLVLLGSGDHSVPSPCEEDPFPDVAKNEWYAPYICAAKKRGIISGFPDGTFQPALSINYANGAKILTKSFGVALKESDLTAVDGLELWYKPYVLALTREDAVAPTVSAFNHLITRGEMAEMIYRLANHKPSYVLPTPETDGEPLGMGYMNPFSLEFSLGLSVNAPDAPYVFAPAMTTLWQSVPTLKGYRFFHALPQIRCGMSGMWEHCDPVFIDWSINLFVTDLSVANAKKKMLLPDAQETLYFGGKPGACSTLGVEGENTTFCFVPLGKNRTLIVERAFIDTNVVYMDMPGITPLKTSDAWFVRIRESMQFTR